MPGSTEKRLSSLLTAGFAAAGVWWHKMEDPSAAHFAGGRARYTRKRPFDYVVVTSGYAVEVKATRGTAFALRPHQAEHLAQFARLGAGEAVIAVFVPRARGRREWALWWLPYSAYRRHLVLTGRTSFPVAALPEAAVRCVRVGHAFLPPISARREPARQPERRLRPNPSVSTSPPGATATAV